MKPLKKLIDLVSALLRKWREFRCKLIARRIARLWKRLNRLQGHTITVDLNKAIYYEVQRKADTPEHKITAAVTNRVLRCFRETLKEHMERYGYAHTFRLLDALLKADKSN